MKKIELTWAEVTQGALVGVMRQIQNLKQGRVDRYGASEENGWNLHIEGACGEMAVAKYLNTYWSGSLGQLNAADVGVKQVRTRSKHHYELILHPDDSDDDIFILVTGRVPMFQIVGWCRGRDGKKKEYWKDPAGNRPAFFVPHEALQVIEVI